MNITYFVIIGGGPAAVSAIIQIQSKFNLLNQRYKIYVIEKSNIIGKGMPYSTSEQDHILNLNSKIMSPIPNIPDDFYNWLKSTESLWKPTYPTLNIESDLYPPRELFGTYLSELANKIQVEAAESENEIIFIKGEAIDVEEGNHHFTTILSSGEKIKSDFLFLCIGHLESSSYRYLLQCKNYIHSPWPSENLNRIDNDEDVIVIGTRLTAIDTVLKLFSNGYRKKIIMISRTGFVPSVIGPSYPYTLQYLNQDKLIKLTNNWSTCLALDDVMCLFWKEIEHAEMHLINVEEILNPEISAEKWLEKEVFDSENRVRPWQSVLIALYPLVEKIWNALKKEDKEIFLSNYYSIWMTYLAAFPLENAKKINQLIKSGKLIFMKGLHSVEYNDCKASFLISYEENSQIKKMEAKYLINATGPGYELTNDPLLNSLIDRGLIAKNPFGGINVDFETCRVPNCKNKLSEKFFAFGEITRGIFLTTTDLSQVTKQIEKATQYITSTVLPLQQPKREENALTQ